MQEASAGGEVERARAAEAALAAARSDVEELTGQLEALRAQAAAKQVAAPCTCLGRCTDFAPGHAQAFYVHAPVL